MKKQGIIGTLAILAAGTSCAQQNQAEVANVKPTNNADALVYEMKAGKVLETGVTGKLVNLNDPKSSENSCATATHNDNYNTALIMDPAYQDREIYGALTNSGYFTDPDAAMKKIDSLLFSSGTMRIFVCINKVPYIASLVPTKNVLKTSKKPDSLTWLYEAAKWDAAGYKSIITIEIQIEKYTDVAGSGAQKKPFSYYALSGIGIKASPSGDVDQWNFGRLEADILAIRKNVETYFKLNSSIAKGTSGANGGADAVADPKSCRTYTPKLIGSTAEELKDSAYFGGADLSKITYDVLVKKGDAEVASKKGIKAIGGFIDFSFTAKEPGTYTHSVTRQLPQIAYPGRANMGRPPNDGYKGETPVVTNFNVTVEKGCTLLPPNKLETGGDYTMHVNFIK